MRRLSFCLLAALATACTSPRTLLDASEDVTLTVYPGVWDFGDVVIGESSPKASFAVRNDGAAPTPAITLALVDDAAGAFVLDPESSCAGMALAPGASCTVEVSFLPQAGGAVGATLAIGPVTVPLTGKGISAGQLVLDPTAADLGSVVQGQVSQPATFTLRNGGEAMTGSIAITIDGDGSADFALVSDGCSGKSLAAATTCTFAVQFTPSAAGLRSVTLHASGSPGGAQTATLGGRGLAPAALSIAPDPLDLGTSVVGNTIGGKLTVTNGGDVETGPLATTVTGNTGELVVSNDGCVGARLAAGASCVISVQAKPTSAGAKTVTLTVASSTPAVSASAVVTTTAVTPGALTLAPASHTYASTLIGATGATSNFTVTNTGGAATGTITTGLSGTGKSSFVIVTDGCNGKALAGAATCTIAVQFQPTARFAQSATLTAGATPGGTASSSLSGVGLAPAVLTANATSFTFGTVDVTTTSAAQTWTVTNAGDVATGALATTITGDQADFQITNGCAAAPLGAGKSCTIGVALAPKSGGAKSLTVTVAGTPGGSVSLSAQGTGRALVALTTHVAGNGGGGVSASPTGSSCGAGCASYVYGTTVTLTATPNASSDFAGWSGACSGTGTCTVTMTAAQDVTATFTLKQVQLKTSVATGGGGTLTTSPTPNGTCGTGCVTYDIGTTVTVTATPTSGGTVGAWGQDCAATPAGSATCMVTMSGNKSASVAFMQTLAVSPSPTNGVISGSGLSCPGGACSVTLPWGSQPTLAATPSAHDHLVSWGGDCAGATCAPMMTQNRTVTATFAADTYTLGVSVSGSGTVTGGGISCPGTCSASYAWNTPVTLTANPATGYSFAGWSSPDNSCTGTSSTCTVTMTASHSVTATFTPNMYTVSFGSSTGNAWGYVKDSTGAIDCGLGVYPSEMVGHTKCSAQFAYGTWVSLTASAQQDSEAYVGAWTGCDSAGGASCSLYITGDRGNAVPNFYGDGVDISPSSTMCISGFCGWITSTPSGMWCGTVPGGEQHCRWRYHWASTVTLHSNAVSTGFFNWSGCDSIAQNGDCIVSAYGTKTITANFSVIF